MNKKALIIIIGLIVALVIISRGWINGKIIALLIGLFFIWSGASLFMSFLKGKGGVMHSFPFGMWDYKAVETDNTLRKIMLFLMSVGFMIMGVGFALSVF